MMIYRSWSSIIALFYVSLVLFSVEWAGAQAAREAPLNPAFLNGAARGIIGGTPGYRPSPVDWSHLQGARTLLRASLPAAYDLRAQGRVTAVRSQGRSGSCWAFGTLASLESCLLPGELADFSENNMKNGSGFDLDPNGGGNRDIAVAYLARWSGPVSEADDPYDQSSTTSPAGLPARKHVQDVIYLPDRGGPADNDAIKQAVMTRGAVMTLYYSDNNYFNYATGAFYNPSTTSVNHAVAIVGWDDNYPAANFSTPPPGNGAFLVKNSWGPDWGLDGYFYISYYEPTLTENTVFDNAEAVSNYTRAYQYDPLGMCGSMGYGSYTGCLANVFTAVAGEKIAAVSTYAAQPNTTYQLAVYLNPTGGPTGGTPAVTQSGAFTEAGYHTVALTAPVPVSAGQAFSVVMKLTTPGWGYPIPIERPYTNYSTAAVSSPGESYMSADGESWTDARETIANANVCLKAFSIPAGAGAALTAVGLSASPASPQAKGTPVTLAATPAGGSSVMYKFEAGLNGAWTTVRDYTAESTASWTPSAIGAYTVKVSAFDSVAPGAVVTKTISYNVLAALSKVSLGTGLASPQPLGQAVRLTATKTGGVSVQYRFSVSENDGASWEILRDFTTTAYTEWTPDAIGTYQLKVAAREGANGAPVESPALAYTITASGPVPETVWDVDLVARVAGESYQVSLGEIAGQAAYVNVEEPEGELLSFYLEQPGQPPLGTDYRVRSVGQQQWQFVVKWDADATAFTDIVLTWPDAGKTPRELTLTLVDLATGARCYMRTAGYFVIPAARGTGEHRFQVIATRELEVPLRILNLSPEVSRATGARVTYTLTRAAEVTLIVRALSGREVSRIALPAPQAAGQNTILWDGRSAAGARLPAGAYHLELLADDTERCRARALAIVNMR